MAHSPSALRSGHTGAGINASLFGRQRTEWLLWVSCLSWLPEPSLPQASSVAPRRPRKELLKTDGGAVLPELKGMRYLNKPQACCSRKYLLVGVQGCSWQGRMPGWAQREGARLCNRAGERVVCVCSISRARACVRKCIKM